MNWKPGDDTIVPFPKEKLDYFRKHGQEAQPTDTASHSDLWFLITYWVVQYKIQSFFYNFFWTLNIDKLFFLLFPPSWIIWLTLCIEWLLANLYNVWIILGIFIFLNVWWVSVEWSECRKTTVCMTHIPCNNFRFLDFS